MQINSVFENGLCIYQLAHLFIQLIGMLEEAGTNVLTFATLGIDSQLIHLFAESETFQQSNFSLGNTHNLDKNRFDHIQIKDEEIERGYGSDQSPEKRAKNKKIKKRKVIVAPRIQPNKYRGSSTKFYIQSLENRIQHLQSQVQSLKSLNKLNLDYIKKINDSELIINGFYQHRQKIVQKLQALTTFEQPNQRRIQMECYSLKRKQGAYGTDRIKAVQYYFKQLIEMIATNSHKYLAEAAFKNSDLFNPASIDSWQEWRKELFHKLNLSPEILISFSQARSEVIQLHTKFNKKVLEMYHNKCNLLQLSREIEHLYEKMNQSLSPEQTGRLLCFLEKYKFESDFYAEDSVRKMYEQLSDQSRFSYQAYSMYDY